MTFTGLLGGSPQSFITHEGRHCFTGRSLVPLAALIHGFAVLVATSPFGKQTLPEVWNPSILKSNPTYCLLHLGMSSSPPGTQDLHLQRHWNGGEEARPVLCFSRIHLPLSPTLFYSLFRFGHFSDQPSLQTICQHRALRWGWRRRGRRRWLLLVFVLSGFILFCFVLVHIAAAEDLFPGASSLPLTHFTLWLIYFSYFPQDLLTLWKVFYLDTIPLSYLVFLPFLPSRFLLISHKESVSRQTSLTE